MKIYFVKCGDMYLADLLECELGSVVLKETMTGAEIFDDLSVAQSWADKTGGRVESYEKKEGNEPSYDAEIPAREIADGIQSLLDTQLW